MSKLLDTKQIVHIVAELMVLGGMTIYFTQKQRRMLTHIHNLSDMINKQNEQIKFQSSQIQMLMTAFETLNKSGVQSFNQPTSVKGPTFINSESNLHQSNRKKTHNDPPLKTPKYEMMPKTLEPTITFSKNSPLIGENESVFEESESEDDEDLDACMEEELSELVEEISDVEELQT